MLRTVLTFPDKTLKSRSLPVEQFDADLASLLEDMYETMIRNNGVGLAAVQVGVPKRVLVICLPDEEGEQHVEERIEVVNPEILHGEGSIVYQEGCLSVPEYYDDVERYNRIIVRFQDRHGAEKTMEAEGFLAVAFQHEIDHLEGRLFVERLPLLKRKKFEKEWKKRIRG